MWKKKKHGRGEADCNVHPQDSPFSQVFRPGGCGYMPKPNPNLKKKNLTLTWNTKLNQNPTEKMTNPNLKTNTHLDKTPRKEGFSCTHTLPSPESKDLLPNLLLETVLAVDLDGDAVTRIRIRPFMFSVIISVKAGHSSLFI